VSSRPPLPGDRHDHATKPFLDLANSLGGAAYSGATRPAGQIGEFHFLTPGVTGTQWQKSIKTVPPDIQPGSVDRRVDCRNIRRPRFYRRSSTTVRDRSRSFQSPGNTIVYTGRNTGGGLWRYELHASSRGLNHYQGDLFAWFLRKRQFDSRASSASKSQCARTSSGRPLLEANWCLPKLYNGKERNFLFRLRTRGFGTGRGRHRAGNLQPLPTHEAEDGRFHPNIVSTLYDPTPHAPTRLRVHSRPIFTIG